MIDRARFDELKNLISRVREKNTSDPLAFHIIATGLGHLQTMRGAMEPKVPLAHSDIYQLHTIISDFEEITKEYLSA